MALSLMPASRTMCVRTATVADVGTTLFPTLKTKLK